MEPVNDSTSNLAASANNEYVSETEETSKTPTYGINSDLGPYWNNGTVVIETDLHMLSVITTYNNIDGLHGLRSTPQYGFNQGMKEFEQAGYNATVSDLTNRLVCML